MSDILAIDLGTTFITASWFNAGKPEILARFPSVVQFTSMGQIIIGEKALERKIGNRENTIDCIKRLIGRTYKEIEKEVTKYTFGIIQENTSFFIDTFYSLQKPEEIASLLINDIKERAEKKTGTKFKKVVLTTPASSNSVQRLALKQASEKIGLKVLKIINEPTAATLAYIYANEIKSEKLAIYNFGGGMFDFSIIEFHKSSLRILSTYGDTQLGGWDLTGEMVNLIVSRFQAETGFKIDLNQSLILKAEMNIVAEEAIHTLSYESFCNINIQNVTRSERGEIIDLKIIIYRSEFEKKISPILKKTIGFISSSITEAKLKINELSKIILVGGCTQIPLVKKTLEDFFYNSGSNHRTKALPLLMDVKNCLGKLYSPEEMVAFGAAIQAGILSKEIINLNIKDIVTKSLGIATYQDKFSAIIKQGEILPVIKGNIYTTVNHYQRELEIEVLQGGKTRASHNNLLGKFRLKDIESAPAGSPKILVNFSIDESGIFNVSAEDLKTKTRKEMLVEEAAWKI